MKILITGAASGIGRRLCERLAARGETVVGADLRAETVAIPNVTPLALDVRDPAGWAAAAQAHSDLDVLINVAGVLRPGWLADIAPTDVDLQLDVNVKGLIYGTQMAARQMAPRGQGRIVNIASLAALLPTPGNAVYSTSKFAARGFSLAAAAELEPQGVALTVVCPAGVQTPMLDLQKSREESAITFSSTRDLTVDEVCDAVIRALDARRPPLEVLVPGASSTLVKWLAHSPALYRRLIRALRKSGRKRQLKQQPSH